MTDEIEPTEQDELSITAQIEANYADMREFAESLPDAMTASNQLMHFYAVHIDENAQMLPDQDKVNVQFLGAIAQLEVRIMRIESALVRAGLLTPRR